MKIFSLFEKKEKKFIAPEMNVQVLILSLMNTYLERCKGDMVLVEEEPDLKKEYERLENLGLKNTENAKLLKAKLEEIETRKYRSEFGKEVMEWIVEMKKEFPNSYLVSFNQFKDILKDYDLITNFLKNYVGTIPSKNISEIESVMKTIRNGRSDISKLLNKYDKRHYSYNNFYYVNGVRFTGDGKNNCKKIQKKVEKIGSIISFDSCYEEHSIRLDRVDELVKELTSLSDLGDFTLTIDMMNRENLMIAAPRTCFSTEFKIQEIPVDPIVFQCCPYGVVIHSVWGEEADSKVLEEYKELNQKILSA